MSEKSKDFPVRKDFLRLGYVSIYWILVICLIGSLMIQLWNLPPEQKESAKKPDQSQIETKVDSKVEKGKEKDPTLTSLIIQPIAESERAAVIFKHIGYLLLLIAAFMLIPIPLYSIKRFKLFNFEYEKDNSSGAEVVKNLTIQQNKFAFLILWLMEDNKTNFLAVQRQTGSFKEFMTDMLGKMRDHYKENWDADFGFSIMKKDEFYTQSYPLSITNALKRVEHDKVAIPINKENDQHIHFKNYLLYCIEVKDDLYTQQQSVETYVIVLNSYRTIFDEYDAQLLAGIVSLTWDLTQTYHKSILIQSMP